MEVTGKILSQNEIDYLNTQSIARIIMTLTLLLLRSDCIYTSF
jgi:hypothetical protein